MNTHLEILVKELIKNGISAKCCEIITDNEGNVSASEPFLDFSEHDKTVAKEKDAQIRELRQWCEVLETIIAEGKKPDISVSENGVSVGCECGGYHLAKERIAELEDRHQSDCIRINQLLTTIDVLTERYQKLREVHGL